MTVVLALAPFSCGWCQAAPATTTVLATPSCASCATADRQTRVGRWLRAVGAKQR